MSDLRFSPQQRSALLARFFEPWTQDAACNTQNGIPGQLWRPMFQDELSAKPHPDDYEWPKDVVYRAMKTCAGCPVRAECLEAVFGETGMYPRQFGIRGGVPGRVREALGFTTCTNCEGLGYLTEIELGGRKVPFAEFEWVYQGPEDDSDEQPKKERAKGYRCNVCDGTGKVPAEDRLEACTAWFEAFTRRRHLDLYPGDQEEAS